ncbi:MAG: sugar transferase [Desulfobacterales bacterium]
MDILGAIAGLIILAPVMLVISLIIKLFSPGPVIFRQARIGYGGQEFNFYKFRTMKQGIDASTHKTYFAELIQSGAVGESCGQPMYKIENDSRIIPCGNFLRKYYLDEIPQLINVLRGEMSLVGPRPPIPYEVEKYSFWHYERFDSLPGMTGLWQISGKNNLTFKEMVRLDIQYSRELSFWLDLKILITTPIMIISEALGNQQVASPDINMEVGKND